jgi:hypothetical protein
MTQRVTFNGNIRSAPVWAGDFGGREHIMPFPAKLNAALFPDSNGAVVTVDTAGAAQGATSIPITALAPSPFANVILAAGSNVLIPAGTTLDFGGAKFARLTADAANGATSLTVAALPTALVAGDKASFNRYGTVTIPSGTVIGRTLAERDAGTPFGPAVATDDEIYLTMFDVPDARIENDVELYRHGSLVKENFLPDYASMSTAAAEVQTLAFTGSATGGTFTMTYQGATTTPLAYNISTANLQTALRALPTIGAGNVTVTGTAGTSYVITGAGDLAGTDLDPFTVDPGGLTGGTPADTVVTTTGGGTPLLTRLRQLYRCIKGVA